MDRYLITCNAQRTIAEMFLSLILYWRILIIVNTFNIDDIVVESFFNIYNDTFKRTEARNLASKLALWWKFRLASTKLLKCPAFAY